MTLSPIASNTRLLIYVLCVPIIIGCSAPSKTDDRAQYATRDVRSRLNNIRQNPNLIKTDATERAFLLDVAAKGNVVTSTLALSLLNQRFEASGIPRESLVDTYIAKLAVSRGVESVLIMRLLEEVIIPDFESLIIDRTELMSTVKQCAASDVLMNAEVQLAKRLSQSRKREDAILLSELISSKLTHGTHKSALAVLSILDARKDDRVTQLSSILRRVINTQLNKERG